RYAFYHRRRAVGRNANQQRAISLFISVVLDQRRQGCGFLDLLLCKPGAVHDHTRHRGKLHREPVLPCAIDTIAARFVGQAPPSPQPLMLPPAHRERGISIGVGGQRDASLPGTTPHPPCRSLLGPGFLTLRRPPIRLASAVRRIASPSW